MARAYKVVDLFAGPGGLAEGFSSVLTKRGGRAFEIALSVEMEEAAHKTLSLRSFARQFPPNKLPIEYYQFAAGKISQDELLEKYPAKWKVAQKEAMRATLGTPEAADLIYPTVDRIRKSAKGRTILIGGPPCQAYSLVGRARNAGNSEYKAEDDGRHFLYREYIDILNRLRPAAFVMENVKGILSSAVSGSRIFERILNDLERVGEEDGGYKLVALVPNRNGKPSSKTGLNPSDFIVRAEQHSIPQSRHRVFVVGLRADVAATMEGLELESLLEFGKDVSVENVLGELPFLRSGLSKDKDTPEAWQQAIVEAAELLLTVEAPSGSAAETKRLKALFRSVSKYHGKRRSRLYRSSSRNNAKSFCRDMPAALQTFLLDSQLSFLPQHETRGHMKSDLARYLFCSVFSEVYGKPPKASDFPEELAPNHRSWSTGKFADRFRVQSWQNPSKTITSHIAKDGHYYIHPDPKQCRSLTVREAARLQTFPDNYLFLGTRTQQYVQVGNAVPPFLAKQIAEALSGFLP
jgi:DNA (cytosine-5)-methyltransferase 1